MDKINLIGFNQPEYGKIKKDETGANNESVNVNELPKNSLEEAIGRSQVNFRGGKSELIKLTTQDKKLIDVLTKVFRLNSEEAKTVEDYTKDFLKENKFKSLTSMKGKEDLFEFVEENACWVDNVSRRLNFSDSESSDLGWLLSIHIDTGDVTKFRDYNGQTILDAFKFSRDYTPFRDIFERNGFDSKETRDIFNSLSKFARQHGSIFDLFKSDKNTGDTMLSTILEDSGVSKDKISDVLIDLHSLANKNMKERLQGINLHAAEDAFYEGINAICMAEEISKKFNMNVTEELINTLEERLSGANIKDIKTIQEVAYRIAERHKLPAGAEKDIINIIKAHSGLNQMELSAKMVETLQKGCKTNRESF